MTLESPSVPYVAELHPGKLLHHPVGLLNCQTSVYD